MTLIPSRFGQTTNRLGLVALFSLGVSSAQAECSGHWNLSGGWRFAQSNGHVVDFDLTQTGGTFRGSGSYDYPRPPNKGIGAQFTPTYDVGQVVEGVLTGNVLSFSISWDSGAVGQYAGTVKEDGFLSGMTYDSAHPDNSASWTSDRPALCVVSKAVDPDNPKKLVPRAGATKPVDPDNPKKLVPRASATKPVDPDNPKKLVPRAGAAATVTADVDVYDTPGGEGEVIGMLGEGAQVSATCRDDQWCAVSGDVPPNGTGWVWGEFLAF